MANYSSLWTSSKDPEFQQIKKMKQLNERRLAMRVTSFQNDFNRHMKKSNDQIRENITILEQLEKDKEQRARHLLATYLKFQKKKNAVNMWTQKYHNSLAQKLSRAKPIEEKKNSEPFVNIVTTRGTVRLKDFSLGNNKEKEKVSLPKIQLEEPKDNFTTEKTEMLDAVESVERANVQEQSDARSSKCDNSAVDVLPAVGSHSKRSSLAESVDSLKVPTLAEAMDAMKKKQNLQDVTRGSFNRKRVLLRSNVYVTFPFVYHSQGEQTCPRYSLFRECTDYDPYVDQASASQGKMSASPSLASHRGSNASLKSILSKTTSRRSSQMPVGGGDIPSDSRRSSKRVSFSNIAHVVKAVQSIQQ